MNASATREKDILKEDRGVTNGRRKGQDVAASPRGVSAESGETRTKRREQEVAAFQGLMESELNVRAPVPGVYFFLGVPGLTGGRYLDREVVQSSLCQLSGVPLGVQSPKAEEKECVGPLELQEAASSRGAPEASSDCVGSRGVSIPGEGDRTPVAARGESPGAAC